MQGRQHQVAGKRRLNGHIGGLQVANLTDHDDIRILTQHGLYPLGKVHIDIGLNLHLIEAGLHHFDGVLNSADIHLAGGQLLEGGIQRGGFPRTSRARHEDDAMGVAGHLVPGIVILFGKAQLLEAAHQHVRIEHPHHHLFPKRGGQRGDTQFDLIPFRRLGLQSPILGLALFRHVQAAKDFQTAGHRRHDGRRQLVHIVQDTIDTEAHLAGFPAWLQMDITGSLGERVLQNPVHNIDDMLVVSVVMPLAHFQQLLEVGNPRHFLPGITGRTGDGAAQVIELDPVTAHLLRIDQHHFQLTIAQHLLQMRLPVTYERLIAGHHHLVTMHFHRHDAVALGESVAHHIGDLIHMHLERINVVHRQTTLGRQPLGQKIHIQQLMGIGPVREAVFGQHLDGVPVQLFLLARRGRDDVEIFLADAPLIQQFAHQPAHINQQPVQLGGISGGVNAYFRHSLYSPKFFTARGHCPHHNAGTCIQPR